MWWGSAGVDQLHGDIDQDRWVWGENEYVLTLGGTFGWRLIAEVLFNVTNSTGTRAGTKIVTITSPGAYNSPVEVATSGGRDLVTC